MKMVNWNRVKQSAQSALIQRGIYSCLCFLLVLLALLISSLPLTATPLERTFIVNAAGRERGGENADRKATTMKRLGSMPLTFIENRGQIDKQVSFYVQGRDTAVYFTQKGIT